MHVVKPALVMWFLRDERRTVAALAIYEVLLIGAIVLLEYHYIVDIVAGFAIIAGMIALDRRACRRRGTGQTRPIT
jgi:membrane-associated phospholipid phosphatase